MSGNVLSSVWGRLSGDGKCSGGGYLSGGEYPGFDDDDDELCGPVSNTHCHAKTAESNTQPCLSERNKSILCIARSPSRPPAMAGHSHRRRPFLPAAAAKPGDAVAAPAPPGRRKKIIYSENL